MSAGPSEGQKWGQNRCNINDSGFKEEQSVFSSLPVGPRILRQGVPLPPAVRPLQAQGVPAAVNLSPKGKEG
eukprot:5231593-Pyramimonas_sp.AAC.1